MDFLSKARSNYGRQANVGPKHTLCRSARTFSELGTPIRSLQAPQRIHFVACQKSAEQPLTSRVVHQHHVQLSSPTRAVKMRRKLGHRRAQRAPREHPDKDSKILRTRDQFLDGPDAGEISSVPKVPPLFCRSEHQTVFCSLNIRRIV